MNISYGQLKVVTTGDIEMPSGQVSIGPDLGFQLLRTGSSSSRFVHNGTGQYQFVAADAAPVSFFTNNTERLQIAKNNGNLKLLTGIALKLGGGPWAALSDRNSKSNINEYTEGLEEVLQINPVSFQYNENIRQNEGAAKTYVGVVAQELAKVVPHMVVETEIGPEMLVDGSTKDYLTVDPNAFTYMLINAIQDQQDLLDEQAERISALEESLQNIGSAPNSTNQSSVVLGDISQAELLQNRPNPFSTETIIDYIIPTNTKSAKIVIFNSNGQSIKSIDINHTGEGVLNVDASNLSTGTYSYNLVLDGRLSKSERMVVTN